MYGSARIYRRSKRTSRSGSSAIRITGSLAGPISTGSEYTIIPNRSTALLAFVAGKLDLTWPYIITVPLVKDIQTQAPQAICELKTQNGTTNLLVNRDAAPFDNADLRRAMALALDRKSFIEILSDGKAKIGGAMLPPPEGLWGMPTDMLDASDTPQ
jgi:peptide/nickel transport system substrate-binding protein